MGFCWGAVLVLIFIAMILVWEEPAPKPCYQSEPRSAWNFVEPMKPTRERCLPVTGVVGVCHACGQFVHSDAHVPNESLGIFHEACCPACHPEPEPV